MLGCHNAIGSGKNTFDGFYSLAWPKAYKSTVKVWSHFQLEIGEVLNVSDGIKLECQEF